MTRRYIAKNENIRLLSLDYDVVIVGSGISGLMCALNISQEKKILIISKSKLEMSNSSLAQGGIAASIEAINKESHIEDTLRAGSFTNDKSIVEQIVNFSDEVVDKLVELGVEFDKDQDGNNLFTKEGGHSERRILHCKDQTGERIIDSLINQLLYRSNITILENTFALDIFTSDCKVDSILIECEDKMKRTVRSNSVILAAGGIGRLFSNTTNSKESTGDGIAMAIRAGARTRDMEFVQFHPTAFNIDIEKGFLISEAVRGEGGKLINSDGKDFMDAIHKLKELAPRDIVSQAIFREIQENRSVYLDIRSKSEDYLKNRFPKIYNHCLDNDIDMSKDLIPVTPVQHYFMGGIEVDKRGRASIDGLYAIGECANTGAHGANRLASNSLLESAAYGLIVSREININMVSSMQEKDLELDYEPFSYLDEIDNNKVQHKLDLDEILKLREEIQVIMSKYVSIEKTKQGLETAYIRITKVELEIEKNYSNSIHFYELLNMITVAKKIVESSLMRNISVGSHIISDRSS